jgi:excisionase family DNA binding protein
MRHDQTPTADQDAYISPDDVARRWDASPQLVYRLIAQGRLPAINIGASTRRATWRIKRSDLARYELHISIAGK